MDKISRRDVVKAAPAVAALAVGGTPLLLSPELLAQKPKTAESEGPFPPAGIDAFLSHFIIAIQILQGPQAGQMMTLSLPAAMQSVSRSDPFIFQGGNQSVTVPLPPGSTLPNTISFSDFTVQPPGFFMPGAQQVWLQILDLDAQVQTSTGIIRIILGQTFQNEYPSLFAPSFGAAQSQASSGGFPASLFFSPDAIIETPFGTFKTRPGKALVGSQVNQFPPVGSSPTLLQPVLLDDINNLSGGAAAEISGLAHPIDAVISSTSSPTIQTNFSEKK